MANGLWNDLPMAVLGSAIILKKLAPSVLDTPSLLRGGGVVTFFLKLGGWGVWGTQNQMEATEGWTCALRLWGVVFLLFFGKPKPEVCEIWIACPFPSGCLHDFSPSGLFLSQPYRGRKEASSKAKA